MIANLGANGFSNKVIFYSDPKGNCKGMEKSKRKN